MNDLLGRPFGPYKIVEELGQGGMAVVYKGYQESLNRYVAVKVLRTELAQDEQFIVRFRREALAVARLSHPNILRVHDAGMVDGLYYIVMDYAEGGSLSRDLAQGPIEMERALSITAQLADALDYAHQNGLIHRDVKPSNVLMASDGRPLLTDFGIAKVLSAETHLTRTGTSIGTPEYMAPEQAQGQTVDGRTDIYALGIMLYEMLAGWVPFSAHTPVATMYKHVNEPPPPLRQVNIRVPEWLEAVVSKALAKNPDGRFARASDLARALRQGGLTSQARTVTQPGLGAAELPTFTDAPGAKRPGARQKRNTGLVRSLVVLITVLVVVLVGGGAYLLLGSGQEPAPTVLAPTPTVPAPAVATILPTAVPAARPGRITFVSEREGNAEIYVMNEDGSGLRNLTMSPSGDFWPQWSPDGSRIAFHSYEASDAGGNAEIYVMDANGRNWIRLTRDQATDKFPGWSPDGQQIVFASNRDGNYEIYVMDHEGSDIRRLTNDPATDYFPTWSPDGQYILFDSDRDGNGEIYLMRADGSEMANLTRNPATDTLASWSPDGTRIAFASDRTGQSEVWVMNSDGSNPVKLTGDEGEEPRWAPTGDKIAFASTRDGDLEIYVMNEDGSEQVRLTHSTGRDWNASWQR